MPDDVEKPFPPTLFGIPGTDEIKRWRDVVSNAHQTPPDCELIGLKEGPNGELIGIFRKLKAKDA